MQILSSTLLITLLCSLSFPQQISIKVDKLNENTAILSSLKGDKVSVYDTIASKGKGEFQFNLDKSNCGFYQISLGDDKWIDFIYDYENVEIETDADNILNDIKVIKSASNKIYYDFIKLNKAYKTKTELLQLILAQYPQGDDYYQITKDKLNQVQKDYLSFVNDTAQINPNSFIARYVRSSQLPVVKTDITFNNQLTYLKTHALNYVNFYDEGLIYSDAFTNKAIEYLTYYSNSQLSKELLEKEFMIVVDTILIKAKVNPVVYQQIIEYLIDGFKTFGFDKVIDYIVDNYIIEDDFCLDIKLGNTLERWIEQARNFKVDNLVPKIVLPDSSGKLVELYEIKTDFILIIFYASWCPHCQVLLPQLYDIYKNQKKKTFEVFAISIDTLRSDWLNFIETNNPDWINVSDLQGWDGSAAVKYQLYATPTMFLVDKQLKLKVKLSSIHELQNFF